MTCLSADKIYLFLENEIIASEQEKIDQHLEACPKCRQAVEERRVLLQASESLPFWDVPPDFTQKVMAEILPQRSSLKSALLAVTVIFSSLITLVFGYLFVSGQTLMSFLIGVNNTMLSTIRSISVTAVQGYKVLSALIRALGGFLSFLSRAFLQLTAIISPQIQIAMIFITLITAIALFIALRKKFLIGERT